MRLDLYVCQHGHRRVVQRSGALRPETSACMSPGCIAVAHAASAEEAFDALLDAYERLALFCDTSACSVERAAADLDAIFELLHVAAEHVHADCDVNGFPLTATPIGALMPALARSAELARSLLPRLTDELTETNHPEN